MRDVEDGVRRSFPGLAIAVAIASVAVAGMGPASRLGATSQPPSLTLTPGSVAFGEVQTGARGEQTVTATNSTPAPEPVEACPREVDDGYGLVLESSGCDSEGVETAATCCSEASGSVEIWSVEVAGSAFAEAEDDCAGSVLAPGDRCLVRVSFTPTEAGELAGTVEFETSGGRATAPLSGVGLALDPTAPASSVPTTDATASSPTQTLPTASPTSPTSPTAPERRTPASVGAAPLPGGPPDGPSATEPIVDRGERRPWWPIVAVAVLVVAGLAVTPLLRPRRGPDWVRTHVRAGVGPAIDEHVEVPRSAEGCSPPTHVVRLEPRDDRHTQTLLEVDR